MLIDEMKTDTRATRKGHIDAARQRLEAELGSPVRRLADLFWEAQRDFSALAWRYTAKAVVVAVVCASALALFVAHDSGRTYYNAKFSVLIAAILLSSLIAAACVTYLLSNKLAELQQILRRKMPNLYGLNSTLASEICEDAFSNSVKREYDRQLRQSAEFVERVRGERLEREHHRTETERFRASGWVEIRSVAIAEATWIQMLLLEQAESAEGTSIWAAVKLANSEGLNDSARSNGARYALFSTAVCSKCSCAVKLGEPYRIFNDPLGFLGGPGQLSGEIPQTGVYQETWLRGMGHDMFRGDWFCPSCASSTAEK